MPNCAKNATSYSILTKTVRYFAIVGDISKFERSFHCIFHAECYARQFHRRKEQTCAQNATISSILKNTVRYFAIVGDISPFERHFHSILLSECYARQFHRRMKQTCAQNASISSILTKTVRYIDPAGDISTFKSYFPCILHDERYARRF